MPCCCRCCQGRGFASRESLTWLVSDMAIFAEWWLWRAQPCLVRSRHKEDLEQKEMRRKEAAAAMSKMEFRSLEGLDLFGVVTGCSNKGTAKGTPIHRRSFV